MLTSFNNAAQSTQISSNTNKRSSFLRGLFRRQSTSKKKPTSVLKQPLKISQCTNKKRSITGGDHVKISSTRLNHRKQPKYYYNDIIDNEKTSHNSCQLSFQGLRYAFKPIKSTSTTNPTSQNTC